MSVAMTVLNFDMKFPDGFDAARWERESVVDAYVSSIKDPLPVVLNRRKDGKRYTAARRDYYGDELLQ